MMLLDIVAGPSANVGAPDGTGTAMPAEAGIDATTRCAIARSF